MTKLIFTSKQTEVSTKIDGTITIAICSSIIVSTIEKKVTSTTIKRNFFEC
jgi:hypothetical protein